MERKKGFILSGMKMDRRSFNKTMKVGKKRDLFQDGMRVVIKSGKET